MLLRHPNVPLIPTQAEVFAQWKEPFSGIIVNDKGLFGQYWNGKISYEKQGKIEALYSESLNFRFIFVSEQENPEDFKAATRPICN